MKLLFTLFAAISLRFFVPDVPNEEIQYKCQSLYFIFLDADGKEAAKIPTGKNIFFIYDTFYKSYFFSIENEQGATELMSFKYITEQKDGGIVMIDHNSDRYVLYDKINEGGKLFFKKSDLVNNYTVLLVFEGINKL
jgi:hypothetical protein